MKINNAMLLAAGLGTRMRPLTLTTPKPLVKVAGQALIDRSLDKLEQAGVTRVVVNLHHLGGQVRAHCQSQQRHRRFEFVFSDESECLLDSGGGVVKALPYLGEEPFFILNSDTFWQEDISNLEKLAANFDADKMDMLLLTHRREQAALPERGDFLVEQFPKSVTRFAGKNCGKNKELEQSIEPSEIKTALGEGGRLTRSSAGDSQAVIYSGALITHPAIFKGQKAEPHSLNLYFDRAIAARRLYGLPFQGRWYTVGTMAAIKAVEALIA